MEKKPKKLPGFLDGLPNRSYILMILAGVYLAYMGYQLCNDVLKGTSTGTGFLIGGIIFLILGAAMAVVGFMGSSLNSKKMEEGDDQNTEEYPILDAGLRDEADVPEEQTSQEER